MFLAHLPAGYLFGNAFGFLNRRLIMVAALIGSVFPDFDLAYFYLVDGRQHHHHMYWTHYPSLWLVLCVLAGIWVLLRRKSPLSWAVFVFGLSALIHLVLDSFVGDIPWLAPFSLKLYSMYHVPAIYQPWWLNFILNWSFLLELLIIVTASIVFVSKRWKSRSV